jgi:catechol-2,3-dioxygenase
MTMTFDHIAITAKNVAETIEYYTSRFADAEVLYSDETWAYLKVGGARIAFVVESQHPPHLAFKVESREELERLASEVGSEIKVHRDKSESFYSHDPSGNAIEIVYYPPKG